VLFVTAPLSSYDITAEADKTLINFVHLDAVLTLVRHAVLQYATCPLMHPLKGTSTHT
jgi:hypothetical protein